MNPISIPTQVVHEVSTEVSTEVLTEVPTEPTATDEEAAPSSGAHESNFKSDTGCA